MFACTLVRGAIRRAAFTAIFLGSASVLALAGVNVSSPGNGATVSSPAHVVASAAANRPITAMRIYIDGKSVYSVNKASLNTYLSMSSGWHSIVVQAWDSGGAVYKSARSVNVSRMPISSGTAAGFVHSQIESMTGWDTCARCAGRGGTGPATPHYISYNVSSPSMDGRSAKFTNAGTVSYSDAIWWKQLGANDGHTHFVYDLYFYIKDTSAAQALEFDVNQSAGGRKYIFGTQCGVNHDHQWDVWGNNTWIKTGIGCSVAPYKWNHLVAEFFRANGRVYYVSVTLNGAKHYINRSYASIGSGAREINVAFQMDQTIVHRTFDTWLDKVTLRQW